MQRRHTAGLAVTAVAALAVVAGLTSAQAAQSAQPAANSQSVNSQSAVNAARAGAAGLGLGQGTDLTVRDVVVDADGGSHVRFDRTYQGLEVVGGDFVVHQNKSGTVRSTSGGVHGLKLSVKAAVTASKARATAKATGSSTDQLVVFVTDSGASRLAYRVNTSGRATNGQPNGTETYIDAQNGRTLASWSTDETVDGTGTGIIDGTVTLSTTQTADGFTMVDPTRGNNETHNGKATKAPLFTDADNVWGNGTQADPQSAGVDAHFGISETWDYYKDVHGRNGIGNDGVGARSFVHDGAYVNASWSDTCFCMRYGDGDGVTFRPLVALDVAGHEMSHGVTSRTAALRYKDESGGLNESTSDIFGTAVEFFSGNANDPGDYVIGEEVFNNYDPANNFIRRMDQPSRDGRSPDFWFPGIGHLNVHQSSGVGNHWFYLLSEGSGAKKINGIAYNSPTANGITMKGIGRAKAEQIWYRTLTTYLTSRSDYAAARTGSIQAATDLYGAGSTEAAAVANAWTAVNVI